MASLSHDRRPAIKFALLHQCPARRVVVQYSMQPLNLQLFRPHLPRSWPVPRLHSCFIAHFPYFKGSQEGFRERPLQLTWNTCSDELGISGKRSRWMLGGLEWVDLGVLTTFRILFAVTLVSSTFITHPYR